MQIDPAGPRPETSVTIGHLISIHRLWLRGGPRERVEEALCETRACATLSVIARRLRWLPAFSWRAGERADAPDARARYGRHVISCVKVEVPSSYSVTTFLFRGSINILEMKQRLCAARAAPLVCTGQPADWSETAGEWGPTAASLHDCIVLSLVAG